MSLQESGSGGLVVTEELQNLLQRPGYIRTSAGGQRIRDIYVTCMYFPVFRLWRICLLIESLIMQYLRSSMHVYWTHSRRRVTGETWKLLFGYMLPAFISSFSSCSHDRPLNSAKRPILLVLKHLSSSGMPHSWWQVHKEPFLLLAGCGTPIPWNIF